MTLGSDQQETLSIMQKTIPEVAHVDHNARADDEGITAEVQQPEPIPHVHAKTILLVFVSCMARWCTISSLLKRGITGGILYIFRTDCEYSGIGSGMYTSSGPSVFQLTHPVGTKHCSCCWWCRQSRLVDTTACHHYSRPRPTC